MEMNASCQRTDAVRSPSKDQREINVRCSRCHALNPREATPKFCDQCGHRLRKYHDDKVSTKHRSSRRKDKDKHRTIESEASEISVTTTSDGGWFWGQQDQLPHAAPTQNLNDTEKARVKHGEEDAVAIDNQTTLQKSPKLRIQKAHTAHATGHDRRSELARPLRRVQSFGENSSSALPPLANARHQPPREFNSMVSSTAHDPYDTIPAAATKAAEPSRSSVHLWGQVLAEAIAEFESTSIILTAEIDSDERCISVLAQRLHIEEASRSKYIVASGTSQLQFKYNELQKKVRMNKEKLMMVQQRLSALYEQRKAEEKGGGDPEPQSEEKDASSASETQLSNQDRVSDGHLHVPEGGEEKLVALTKKKTKRKKKEGNKPPKTTSSSEEQERLACAAVKIQKRFRVLRARRLFAAMVKRAYQRVYDADSKRYFYYNPRTNESQWEVPQALAKAQDIAKLQLRSRHRRAPSTQSLNAAASRIQALYRRRAARVALRQMLLQVYEKVYDAESNSFYYYCKKTKTSSWEKPKLLRDSDLDSPVGTTTDTQLSQQPADSPDDAERKAAAVKIQTLYRHRATRRFLRDLAGGNIEKHYDEAVGAWYYYNHRTQMSFWEQPRHASLQAAMPKPRP